MFELSIIRKYLIPRRTHLSVALIASMSVGVITLIVWLLLVFLSITHSIEENWLGKLTAINAPIRINPTPYYYNSFYSRIDSVSEASSFIGKTIGQKALALLSNPYNPSIDPEIPHDWPKPDLLADGSFKDPVKIAYKILHDLKSEENALKFHDYEVAGALLKLQLLREESDGSFTQSFVTQAAYVATLADDVVQVQNLLLPPSSADIKHLLLLAKSKIQPQLNDHLPIFGKPAISLQSQEVAFLTENIEEKFPITSEQQLVKSKPKIDYQEAPKIQPHWAYRLGSRIVLPELPHREKGVLLPKSLQDVGAKIGDRGFIAYQTATLGSIQEQRVSIFVAGFYDPGILPIGSRCILAPTEIVRAVNASASSMQIDRSQSNGIQIWLPDLKQTEALKKKIQDRFEKAGIGKYWLVSSYHDYEFAKDLLHQFRSDRLLFTLIGLIILIVACCNVLSFLVILVNDKKKEIGILQAMGARSSSIALIFGGCGAAVGFLSSLVGMVLAFFTLQHLDVFVQWLSIIEGGGAMQTAFYGMTIPNHISRDALVFVIIAAPILSIIAGFMPALKACSVQPSETLRSD